ncbi:molybdopterin molybdenumtransferase MoeA [Devosia pacifica]|uniref:Molybdopterin molybdenumtransferase n=1 Tax=Devosia pacifica TaxID=1335967 RepID=A0A918RU72_9HYPH|nr:gephyrin-like molybdotransferase Glp [Devosia pacifica]GHA12065.1 molybdopterin molybdenumtransferase MoeA [Devosia pacifica]
MSLLPVDEALARILARVPPVISETVPLEQADGRVLAEPLKAQHNQPPFDASAMDGYAVRAADVEAGQPLSVIGTSQAGAGFDGTISQGEVVRIFTGAPLPGGADAVIMQEEADRKDDKVSFRSTVAAGRSVRPRGNDFAAGSEILPQGTRLGPFSLALAAAANAPMLEVARRPRIGVLATGDELILPGQTLAPGQIVASNSYGLAPLLSSFAESTEDLGIVRDNRQSAVLALSEALDSGFDILITTGGASVGEHDIVQDVLQDLGVEIDFWRVNMRPGKPLMFGHRGKTLVFGLPGNPVSAMVTATVFILPALRRWLGLAEAQPLRLPLAGTTTPNGSRRHFLRGRIVTTENGTVVLPIPQTDSAHLSSLASADALIIQPEDDPGGAEGDLVWVLPLDQAFQ